MQNSEIIAVVLTPLDQSSTETLVKFIHQITQRLRVSWAQFWKSLRKMTPQPPGPLFQYLTFYLWRIFPYTKEKFLLWPFSSITCSSFIICPWEVWVHPLCHRIIEWVELEKILRIISFQSPALDRKTFHQTRIFKALFNLALNISRDVAATIYLGNLIPSIS